MLRHIVDWQRNNDVLDITAHCSCTSKELPFSPELAIDNYCEDCIYAGSCDKGMLEFHHSYSNCSFVCKQRNLDGLRSLLILQSNRR